MQTRQLEMLKCEVDPNIVCETRTHPQSLLLLKLPILP